MRNYNNKWKLRKLLRESDLILCQNCKMPLSKKARTSLRRLISKDITQLVYQSEKNAEGESQDYISEKHVKAAGIHVIRSKDKGFHRHLGTVGGIILGASLSALLALISEKHCTTVAVLIPVVLSILGTFMVAWHIALDS